jgi:hypothetical protein
MKREGWHLDDYWRLLSLVVPLTICWSCSFNSYYGFIFLQDNEIKGIETWYGLLGHWEVNLWSLSSGKVARSEKRCSSGLSYTFESTYSYHVKTNLPKFPSCLNFFFLRRRMKKKRLLSFYYIMSPIWENIRVKK